MGKDNISFTFKWTNTYAVEVVGNLMSMMDALAKKARSLGTKLEMRRCN